MNASFGNKIIVIGLFFGTFGYLIAKRLLLQSQKALVRFTQKSAFRSFIHLNEQLMKEGSKQSYLQRNEETLLEIIRTNANTDYGRKYGFSNIKSMKDYRENLPTIFYSDIQTEIEELAAGKSKVLSKGKVIYFATSSGTTGKQKLIPITYPAFMAMNKLLSRATGAAMEYLHKEKNYEFTSTDKTLMITYNPKNHKKTAGGISYGALSQMKRALPWWLQFVFAMTYSAIGVVPTHITDLVSHFETNLLLQGLFSIMEEKIGKILVAFASIFNHFFSTIQLHFQELIECIREGSLTPCKDFVENIEASIIQRIDRYIKQHYSESRRYARVTQLQKIDNFDEIVKKLWPDVLCVGCSVTGAFSMYESDVRKLLGPNVPLFGSVYLSSEGCMGFQYNEAGDYFLDPDTAFFEFIEEDKMEDVTPSTLLVNELQVGKNYEIVITTISGFYRYRVGDVITVVDKVNNQEDMILFRVAYRTGSILDAFGEKTTEKQVEQALTAAANDFHCNVVNFTSSLSLHCSPVVYVIFAEFSKEFTQEEKEKFTQVLDDHLQHFHPIYADYRSQNKLGRLTCFICPTGKFMKFKELMISEGASPLQVKTPRLLKKPSHIQFFSQS